VSTGATVKGFGAGGGTEAMWVRRSETRIIGVEKVGTGRSSRKVGKRSGVRNKTQK